MRRQEKKGLYKASHALLHVAVKNLENVKSKTTLRGSPHRQKSWPSSIQQHSCIWPRSHEGELEEDNQARGESERPDWENLINCFERQAMRGLWSIDRFNSKPIVDRVSANSAWIMQRVICEEVRLSSLMLPAHTDIKAQITPKYVIITCLFYSKTSTTGIKSHDFSCRNPTGRSPLLLPPDEHFFPPLQVDFFSTEATALTDAEIIPCKERQIKCKSASFFFHEGRERIAGGWAEMSFHCGFFFFF